MKIYLIAKKLSHSFSKPIHNELSDYSYEYKELLEEEVEDFLLKKDFDGLNVTIPYKQKVMPYLDYISPEAQKIGSVNTVVKKGARLFGYNTDYYGFCYEIEEAKADLKGKDVVILGTGGTAKTAVCVAQDMGAKRVRTVTSGELRAGDTEKYLDAQIVINATPVGMYPNTLVSPVEISQFEKCEAVLDVIYNPSKTKLIMDAQRLGLKTANGLSMLVAQAKKACELFEDRTVDEPEILRIKKKIERKTKNIILVGMPGCGKSTVGRELSERLGRTFYDCDEEISKRGKTPAELIEECGEEHMRDVESDVLASLCKESSLIIATGGGAVTKERNFDIIKQNATVVFIERPLKFLSTRGRPLSQGGIETLEKMYAIRYPLYKKIADFSVESQRTWQETTSLIENELNKR